ncbi:MAG: hypothetical protein K2H92_06870, partial [Bacteroidaceae bacterium]|nr:hypothetical protein [Bacteroidaceae bacterium]
MIAKIFFIVLKILRLINYVISIFSLRIGLIPVVFDNKTSEGARPCGERGIRTPDTLLAYTRFPGVPLQP